ncbi:hypothetical protein [Empedobacter tilapiae]|uniref:Uncharacterized protein n=1 Tax=Empedobacter tilapiae TaxID=2491114 RepID=A0A4Z1AUM0_9FLAO|nr:hypothetical protein [Empedobacter tilapiae]TGN23043.1 hypothetical protein E4J94_14960 [Empedobacter tilapiae]
MEKSTLILTRKIRLIVDLPIDFCINNKAGTLILLDQEEKMELAKDEEFVLRNWSYYELMTKIKYKADKAGIELIIA